MWKVQLCKTDFWKKMLHKLRKELSASFLIQSKQQLLKDSKTGYLDQTQIKCLRKKINWKLGSAHKDSKPQVVTCILKHRHTLKLSSLALPSLDKITPATQDYLQPYRWVVEFFCLVFFLKSKLNFYTNFFQVFQPCRKEGSLKHEDFMKEGCWGWRLEKERVRKEPHRKGKKKKDSPLNWQKTEYSGLMK